MRIERIAIHRIEFTLRAPYTIAYETIERVTNLLVAVEASDGLVGLGCAAPAAEVTGETTNDCEAALQRACTALRGKELDPQYLIAELGEEIAAGPAARAAVDMAGWDLAGKVAGRPVYALLGARHGGCETSVTIGICGHDDTVAAALAHTAAGFRSLKLKGGLDVEQDIERVRGVHAAVGEAVTLRFDANQGYDLEGALGFARAIRGLVELIEQPLQAGAEDELAELRGQIGPNGPPLMVDESLIGAADARRLIALGAADLFNIKLMKAGGIAGAREVDRIGMRAGIESMISCMDEATLGIAAGLHLALASPGITRVDLDGHLDLIDDPTSAAVTLADGRLYPARSPGLGLSASALDGLPGFMGCGGGGSM